MVLPAGCLASTRLSQTRTRGGAVGVDGLVMTTSRGIRLKTGEESAQQVPLRAGRFEARGRDPQAPHRMAAPLGNLRRFEIPANEPLGHQPIQRAVEGPACHPPLRIALEILADAVGVGLIGLA